MGPVLAVLLALAVGPAPVAATGVGTCAGMGGSERGGCLEAWAREARLDWRAWRDLDALVLAEPGLVLEALDALSGRGDPVDAAPGRAASVADLRGRCLTALGRHEEAVAAFREALRLDDGVVRLTWISEPGAPLGETEIDPGSGRLLRAASALAAAGNEAEARALVERAIALGAGTAARELWTAPSGNPDARPPGAAPVPLAAPTWFPGLPRPPLVTIDGRPVALPPDGARALILDFWASWCVPCAEQLPRLQALLDERGPAGLEIVAINMGETADAARRFAETLGLSIPIVPLDVAIDQAFDVQTLPTLVLADRLGRIRGRWDGTRSGLHEELDRLVGELLDDARAVPLQKLGEVVLGAGMLEPLWSASFPARIEGLAPAAMGQIEDEARVLIVAAGQFAVLGSDGAVLRRHDVGAIPGLLRTADLDRAGAVDVVGFRRGARGAARIDAIDGTIRAFDAPAPVLAVTLEPATAEREGAILLGTTAGLFRAGGTGAPLVAVGEYATEVRDVVALGDERLVLEPGRFTRADAEGRVLDRGTASPRARSIVVSRTASGRHLALAPEAVTAATTGRFVDASAAQLALATAGGQLVILDSTGEAPLFRARWDDITALATGDVDRDGTDDLLIASGSRVTVLSAPKAPRP